jgi:hypothetical protein
MGSIAELHASSYGAGVEAGDERKAREGGAMLRWKG